MRWVLLMLLLLGVALAWAAVSAVDDWSDWVVLGAIVFAAVGFMIAINRRQYPTRKRAFTRDSESRW